MMLKKPEALRGLRKQLSDVVRTGVSCLDLFLNLGNIAKR